MAKGVRRRENRPPVCAYWWLRAQLEMGKKKKDIIWRGSGTGSCINLILSTRGPFPLSIELAGPRAHRK